MLPADLSQILPTPQQQSNHQLEFNNNPKTIKVSKYFPTIIYSKKTLKKLLEQRTKVCLYLGLTSKQNLKKGEINNKQQILNCFDSLFIDCNSGEDLGWILINQKVVIYGFISSQGKQIPSCIHCDYSIWLSLRGNTGKIFCSNVACSFKVLGQFQYGIISTNKNKSSVQIIKKEQEIYKQQKKQKVLSQQQIAMINLASKKVKK